MVESSSEPVLTIYFSRWKVLLCMALAAWLAIFPFSVDFQSVPRLAFYSTPPGNIIIYGAAIGCGLLGLVSIFVLRRAMRKLPAVVVTDDSIFVYSLPARTISRSKITEVVPPKMLVATIKIAGEKPLSLPLGLYKDHAASWERLEALLRSKT